MYRFQHLSYQEYLAACELAQPRYFPQAVGEKISTQPGRWRNVIPLLIDIVAQRSERDVQALGRVLLPQQNSSQLPADHVLWEMIVHAARLHAVHVHVYNADEQRRLAAHIIHLIEQGALAPGERAEMGRILAQLGDTRRGVGTTFVMIAGKVIELPEFVWCDVPAPPGNKFVMGATDQNDNPRREVNLTYSFKIAKYVITYRQFQTFIDSGEFDQPEWWAEFPPEYQPQATSEQNNRYANHPRDNVSWYQAVAFARWLTAKQRAAGLLDETLEIRLPLETEWEYAARATDERQYPYEGDFDAAKGNTSSTLGRNSASHLAKCTVVIPAYSSAKETKMLSP